MMVEFVYNVDKPASPSEIKRIEDEFNCSLPQGYKDLMSRGQSPWPAGDEEFDYIDTYTERLDSCGIYFGAVEDGVYSEEPAGILEQYNSYIRADDLGGDPLGFPKDFIPIGSDGGGGAICFNAADRDKKELSVWLFRNDTPIETCLSFIADSFDEFLNKLHPPKPVEYI